MQIYNPRVRQSDLFSEEIHGERVIYDNSNQKVHRLNPTMSWVWSHCDGSRTLDDLIAAMQGETGNDDARGLITSGLKQLGDANLLEPESVDLNALMTEPGTVQSACGGRCGSIDCRTCDDFNACTHASSGKIGHGKGQGWQEEVITPAVLVQVSSIQSPASRFRQSLFAPSRAGWRHRFLTVIPFTRALM